MSTPQESEVRATHTRSISSKHRRFNWEMIPYMTFSITFMPGNKKKLLIIYKICISDGVRACSYKQRLKERDLQMVV